jgi:hypothetical protein
MKKELSKRSRCYFITVVIFLFAGLMVSPAVWAYTTDEIYDVEYEMGWTQIPYGNGIDDDHDGTIDENDGSEPDVQYGTKEVNTGNNTVFDSWYDDYVQNGVVVGGSYEELWKVSCSDNVSISPTQTCYMFDTITGLYSTQSNVINAVTYYINIPASKLMNGASELWYRSPLRWDDSVFYESGGGIPYHYINIYDDVYNLVYASSDHSLTGNTMIPSPTVVADDSGYERLYYKINMNFRTEVTYRVEEYVKTIGNNPINSVDLFMARFQDIADDGEINTYNFWNTSHARKVATECSWSCIFTLGKGIQGGEKILFGGQDYTIETQKFPGDSSINNVGSAMIIFPIRTTRPLNITVRFKVYSGSTTNPNWQVDMPNPGIVGACGTVIYAFNLTDPNATEPNYYKFELNITNLDEDYNGLNVSEQAMTFYMFPSYGNVIMITNETGMKEVNHFACHIEMSNEKTPVVTSKPKSPNFWMGLVGFFIIIIGIILVASVIGAAIGVPLLFAGGVIGTGTALAGVVGAAATLLGTAIMWAGASGYTLQQLFKGIASGAVRIINTVIKGIQVIAGAVWDGLLWVITQLIALGNAIAYWGAGVINIIWEVMWFAAFIFILYCWNWFLVLMKHLSRGDIESAFAHATKPVKKYAKKTIKTAGKYRKWRRREKREDAAETRKDRESGARIEKITGRTME